MAKQTALFSGVNIQQPKEKKKIKSLAERSKSPRKKSKARTARTKEDVLATLKEYSKKIREMFPELNYRLIKTQQDLLEYLNSIKESGLVSFDTETTGIDEMNDHVVGFSMYTPNDDPVYVSVDHEGYEHNLDVKWFMENLMNMSREEITTIPMANAMFDQRVTKRTFDSPNYIRCMWDVNLAGKFLNENESKHNLKFLWEKYILGKDEKDIEPDSYKKLFGKHKYGDFNPELVYVYAAHDAVMTYQLYEFQREYLHSEGKYTEQAGLVKAGHTFKMWNYLSEAVASMMDNGVSMHKESIEKSRDSFDAQLKTLRLEFDSYVDSIAEEFLTPLKNNDPELFEKIDFPLNPASSKQLGILFFDAMGLHKVKGRSTDVQSLEMLQKKHPEYKRMFEIILEYRDVSKLQSTYVESLLDKINPETGKIHANFKPYGAVTGRFSSKNPNLQNIPARKEIGKVIRKMFGPSEGYYLIGSDFSQQEPRILADMSTDDSMINAYRTGKDLYSDTASRVYNVPYEQCLEINGKEAKQRRTAMKSVILGIMYGRSSYSIKDQLGISIGAAKSIISKFYQNFPNVQNFVNEQKEFCRKNGFVYTAWGRKRRIPEVNMKRYEFKGNTSNPELLKEMAKELDGLWSRDKKQDKLDLFKKEFGVKVKDNSGKIAHAERQVINSIVQGSAADMINQALVDLYFDKKFNDLGGRILITVHDEIIGEAPKENAYEALQRMDEVMIKAGEKQIKVPMKCDGEINTRWTGNNIKDIVYKETVEKQNENREKSI